jgi:hypothetical protein
MTKIAGSGSRIRIRIRDPDPLVRSMDPRIWIRIHPKMSWIRNTAQTDILVRLSRSYDYPELEEQLDEVDLLMANGLAERDVAEARPVLVVLNKAVKTFGEI